MVNVPDCEHKRTTSATAIKQRGVNPLTSIIRELFQPSILLLRRAVLSPLASSHYDTEQKQNAQKPRQAKALLLIHGTCLQRHRASISFLLRIKQNWWQHMKTEKTIQWNNIHAYIYTRRPTSPFTWFTGPLQKTFRQGLISVHFTPFFMFKRWWIV